MSNTALYRYLDRNTYTDNLTLTEARNFKRLQGGGRITPMTKHMPGRWDVMAAEVKEARAGLIPSEETDALAARRGMTNKEIANTLRSAASAIEHGRYSTYLKKLTELMRESEKTQPGFLRNIAGAWGITKEDPQ